MKLEAEKLRGVSGETETIVIRPMDRGIRIALLVTFTLLVTQGMGTSIYESDGVVGIASVLPVWLIGMSFVAVAIVWLSLGYHLLTRRRGELTLESRILNVRVTGRRRYDSADIRSVRVEEEVVYSKGNKGIRHIVVLDTRNSDIVEPIESAHERRLA